MNREFLEKLGLEKEVIDNIMREHGKSVQSAKPEDYEALKSQASTHQTTIQELKDKLASETEKYKGYETEKTELLNDLSAYKINELKIRVARDNNIPFELANRLTGETEEDLVNDAKSLSTLVTKNDVLPLKQEGVNDTNAEENAYKNMLENLGN